MQPGPKRVRRRAALRMMAHGAAMVALAACGTSVPSSPAVSVASPTAAAPPGSAATGTSATPAAAPRKTGGTLRIGVPADISSLDAHTSSSLLSITQSMAFDRLVAYDVAAKPRPMLAESWDVTPDYKQVKLNIRKGVQWHSGREFTSDDVKWNLLRGQDAKAATGSYVNQASWFPTIETADKYTAILKSDVSRPAIFDYLNVLNMVDQVSLGGPDAKTMAIGTGPFVFKEWVQGDHLTYSRNPNYWRTGYPYLDGIIVNVVRDLNAMSTRLEAGALDAIYGPNITEFLRFKDDPSYQALIPPGQQSGMAMGVNTLFPPTDNKLVRQALNYAADRKRFTDQIFRGIVRPVSLPWDPNSLAYEASKESFYTFDLDKARSLLASVGVSSAELDFLASPNTPEWDLISQIYQSDLASIGIKLNVVKLDQAAWLDQVNNRKYHGFWASTMAIGTGEPVSGLSLGRATDPNSNNEGYRNDAYTELINGLASEPDVGKRKAMYSQVNDILLDDAFAMVVTTYPPKMVASTKVHDLVTPESVPSNFWLTDVWLDS
ncbi:MAG: ABC transporter substrate-binding protein [Chloroflexi bacterium]|nr:ABC transporter substrate-binding protein [Chloroflexota bacterium]MBV9600267.1 ABC transporter substrate-binding protein [Chloroflexota bacterium]